jgi:hypothetical protein
MNISDIASASSAAQGSDAVSLAVQKMALDSMKSQGSQLSAMLGSAAPLGSVNSPSQGTRLDAWA